MKHNIYESTEQILLPENEVVELMKSSNTEEEWNSNCDRVKNTFGGQYPTYWYSAIVMSGVASETAAKWGSDAEIKIISF